MLFRSFTSTASCESRITYIDGDQGVLLYRGYPIEDLAEHSDFMEVCYLLLKGELPNAAEKASMSIYHPYCFTRSSLEHLLGRHGFRVRSAATNGRPASVLSRRYLTVLATNEPQAEVFADLIERGEYKDA